MARVGRVHWYGDQLRKAIRDNNPDALFEAGEELEQVAEDKAPRGFSGDLRDSGYVSTTKRSTYEKLPVSRPEVKPNSDETAAVGFSAFYAHFVEFGTIFAGAQPYLRPAVDETGSQVAGKYAKKMRSALEKTRIRRSV